MTALEADVAAQAARAGERAAAVAAKVGCFASGTLISTREGLKAIETIAVGDLVWSQPEFQGERGWRRVNEVFHREPQDMVDVTIADGARRETITATTEHPFWVKGQGWTGAQDLAEGALVELADGRDARVVLVERLEQPQPIFNFAVDGFHTYYVGELGVWVHNTSKAGALAPRRTFGGGAHGRLNKSVLVPAHHMPADSVSPFTKYSGPAIQMELVDHVRTSSHGWNGAAGAAYRQKLSQLIANGQIRKAMIVEIQDVRRVSRLATGGATKYNPAMLEMLVYARGAGYIPKGR